MKIDIGIIGAMEEEVSLLVSSLSGYTEESVSGMKFYLGTLHEKRVAVVKCGIGKVFAAVACEAMAIKYSPSLIINTGVGGAISDGLSTGDIVFQYEEDKLVVDATYWNDLEIDYTTMKSLSYVEHMDAGSREFGFGSLRLLMGAFRNDTLGNYTRYSYTDCDSCVVITVSGKTIVLGAKTKEKTLEIYEILKKKSGL